MITTASHYQVLYKTKWCEETGMENSEELSHHEPITSGRAAIVPRQ